MFDDKFIKSSQKEPIVQSGKNFLSSCSQYVPLMTLYEDFLDLFDELHKAFHFESKEKDNQEDELLKLVDEAIKNFEIHDEASPSMRTTSPGAHVVGENVANSDSQSSEEVFTSTPNSINQNNLQETNDNDLMQGENTSNNDHFQGENISNNDRFQGENKVFDNIVQGENHETVGNDDQSKIKEVNAKIDPEYDLNYPPLMKCTKDHPQTQVIGEKFSRVLSRAQIKEKQTLLTENLNFVCLILFFLNRT